MAKKTPATKTRRLTSPAEVVRWMGGINRTAAWAGYSRPQSVSGWLKTGIPSGFQHRLFLKAKVVGVSIEPEAFGLSEDGTPLRG